MTDKTRDRYFDHKADIGIIGRGKTICDAFTDAAKSLFGIMTDLSKLPATHCITFEFEEPDIEFAFVTYLNLLIEQARTSHIVFKEFQLENFDKQYWHARACGEYWQNISEHGVEVKGATLTMLSVSNEGKHWKAQCIVDV